MKKTLYALALILCFSLTAQAQAPAVALSPVARQQFLSITGAPLASACLFTYVSGTSTPLATYTSGTGAAQNTNPVILDSGGFANLWLTNASYRFTLVSAGGTNCSTGVFQYTVDNISSYSIINQAQNLFLLGATSDPAGSAGELSYRTDIPCFRGFTTFWDCFVTLTAAQTLTNKTLTNAVINGATIGTSSVNGVTTSGTPTTGQIPTATSASTATWQSRTIAIPFIIDGAGAVVTTGSKGYIEIPFNCTITGWTILADQVGSSVVDVKRSTYAGFPTTASITGADPPTLVAVQKNHNLAVSLWTTAITGGDILEFNVTSAATVTRLTISLRATVP